jgi:predicted PurR-regulated permease PerM
MERILFLVLLGLLAYLVYLIFQPFLISLAWAAILTVMFYPVHRRVGRRVRGASRAALVSTLLLAALIITPGLLVFGAVASQAVDMAQWVQAEWSQGRMPLRELWDRLPVERVFNWLAARNISAEELTGFVSEKLQQLAGFLAGQVGRLARNVAVLVFDLFVTLFATFYLFRDGPGMLDLLRRALPLEERTREKLLGTTYNVLYASVFSGIVVAAVQGLLGGLLFWMLGLGAPVLWGMVMAFLSFLPLVGPWMVWVPAGIYLLVQGSYGKAVVLAIGGGLVVSMADNVLRPILLSGRTQMNGLLVFIGILGGVAAFGLLGIVLGPILVALADAVIEAYTSEPASASG